MRFYEASSMITSSPGTVWAVLADGGAWPSWGSGVERVGGRIAPGGRCRSGTVVRAVRARREAPGQGGCLIAMPRAEAGGDPFEALGDATRREILRLLSDSDKAVHEIAAALPISRPAVSRHLRLLKDAGMVAEHAQGTRRIYHLEEEGLRAVQAYLEDVWGQAVQRFRLLAENTDASPRPRR